MTHRALTAALAVLATTAFATADAQEEPAPRLVGAIQRVAVGIGRIAVDAQGERIAFDRREPDGFHHVFTAEPDTVLARCLTCDPTELRRRNALNPVWHPSGDYLVFQLQQHAKRLSLDPTDLATANRGLWGELWLITADGKSYWQLTRAVDDGHAVMDPHFSHEGDRLLWSERVRSRIGRWGTWALNVAEVEMRRVPRLGKVTAFEPGPQKLFLAGSAFTPDDRGALIFGNREPGQLENGMDIYRLDFDSGRLDRLTNTRRAWDEQARYSPRGDRIVWASAAEIPLDGRTLDDPIPLDQLRDLWTMNTDGSDKLRLTRFNDPEAPEGLGPAIVDDFDFHPRGDWILAHVVFAEAGEVREALYRVELDASFRR